eukprot:919381_1
MFVPTSEAMNDAENPSVSDRSSLVDYLSSKLSASQDGQSQPKIKLEPQSDDHMFAEKVRSTSTSSSDVNIPYLVQISEPPTVDLFPEPGISVPEPHNLGISVPEPHDRGISGHESCISLNQKRVSVKEEPVVGNEVVMGKELKANDTGSEIPERSPMREKTFQCPECPKRFTRHSWMMNVHMRIHTGEFPFRCPYCDGEFRWRASLKKHKEREHGDPNAVKQRYPCSECSKDFSTRTVLKTHMRSHSGELPYSCDFCPRQFRWQTSLQVHTQMHTEEKPYECGICSKWFATRSSLGTHMRKHSGETPFECDVCSKRFMWQTSLRVHVKAHHSGKKPVEVPESEEKAGDSEQQPKKSLSRICSVCDKNFSTPATLKTHVRSHSGESPYECEICSETFMWQDSYRKHVKKHEDGSASE